MSTTANKSTQTATAARRSQTRPAAESLHEAKKDPVAAFKFRILDRRLEQFQAAHDRFIQRLLISNELLHSDPNSALAEKRTEAAQRKVNRLSAEILECPVRSPNDVAVQLEVLRYWTIYHADNMHPPFVRMLKTTLLSAARSLDYSRTLRRA